MASPTNLTDRISKLRERKESSSVLNSAAGSPNVLNSEGKCLTPSTLAFDYFATFSYILFFLALIGQLILIVSLDIF